MKYILMAGLILMAASSGIVGRITSPEVKSSSEMAASETVAEREPLNTPNVYSDNVASVAFPTVSPMVLKTANFCEGSSKHKNHEKFLKDLNKALGNKYDARIREIFDNSAICYNPDIFKMTGTWAKLEKEVLTKDSLKDGEIFYESHKQQFDEAYKKYGVDPSAILGILRIETNFGENFGEYPLVLFMYNRYFEVDKKSAISRLATWLPLAFEFGWDPYVGGSHAGAFGYPQFMPQKESLHYAADGNGDGKINLFSVDDAIHSVARYLSEHGWGEKSNKRVVMKYNHSSEYANIVLKYRSAVKPLLN